MPRRIPYGGRRAVGPKPVVKFCDDCKGKGGNEACKKCHGKGVIHGLQLR